MARSQPKQNRILGAVLPPSTVASLVLMLIVVATSGLQAQTYTVLHNFTHGADGAYPDAGVTLDKAGNLYGTASGGGTAGYGTVFKLVHVGSGWTMVPLYSFTGYADGANPLSPVTIGPDGSLFGTTIGLYDGQGTLFNLKPPPTRPPTVLSPWKLTVLHTFTGKNGDGDQPLYGPLIFDPSGNLYGTTQFGGTSYLGVVYEETPYGNGWIENVLYSFGLPTNGPLSGVVRDTAGNLYGTTADGGAVFELSPSGSGWVATILHTFTGKDGLLAYGGLVMDAAGNLYGGASDGGKYYNGDVYELTPSNGTWAFQVIYNFSGGGPGPYDTLTLDAAGNLYGTTFGGGSNDAGTVFKLTPSNGSWTYTDLHDFDFRTDYFPYGSVTIDANGNLFGTASQSGANGYGAVWEITP